MAGVAIVALNRLAPTHPISTSPLVPLFVTVSLRHERADEHIGYYFLCTVEQARLCCTESRLFLDGAGILPDRGSFVMRIGIIPQGGKDWIAGVIYLQNLVRALNLLPEEERPSLYFILGPGNTVEDYQDLGRWLPPSKHYTFRTGTSLKLKIRNTLRHTGSSHWPMSFERLTQRLDLSALFPLQSSLGAEFSCAWIGWIPDFQHKRMPEYFSAQELRTRDECFQRMVREAPHNVVSSQDAYRDLMRWFPTAPERVSVFPFVSVAPEEWYDGNPREIIDNFGLPKKYLLFPSQFWVHKNHRCVFEAIRILKESSCPKIALV